MPPFSPHVQRRKRGGLVCVKTKESVGKVIPCQASAKHSEIEGSATRRVEKGRTESITVRSKDRNGVNLTTGGDVITARFTSDMAAAQNSPTTTITDNNNGTYTISCACLICGRIPDRGVRERREDGNRRHHYISRCHLILRSNRVSSIHHNQW